MKRSSFIDRLRLWILARIGERQHDRDEEGRTFGWEVDFLTVFFVGMAILGIYSLISL